MLIQRIFAWIDRKVSAMFRLESWGTPRSNGNSTWLYFVGTGKRKRVGVVGADGKIHTITGSRTVRHYYQGGRLIKRVLVRKDLKEGERLATEEEIEQHCEEFRKRLREGGDLFINI